MAMMEMNLEKAVGIQDNIVDLWTQWTLWTKRTCMRVTYWVMPTGSTTSTESTHHIDSQRINCRF